MTIIDHGTFKIYQPVLPPETAPPTPPERPTPPPPVLDDASDEQRAAHSEADAQHTAAMTAYDTAQTAYRTASAAHAANVKLRAMIQSKVLFGKRADGADWYDINHALPTGRTYVQILNGRVTGITTDLTSMGLIDGMTVVETANEVQPNWIWDGTALSPPGLDEVKTRSTQSVDAAAERARMAHLTGGVGHAMTYQRKSDERKAYISAKQIGAPIVKEQFPMLWVSVGTDVAATGDDVADLGAAADLIGQREAAFAQAGAAIERIRKLAKLAIAAATTVEEVEAAARVVWP